MEEELISKKDLLELTGISYGQLYRWKRKNLIPEEWFVRKSAFTGQETYFPKGKILARMDKILNMKDELSLDALADMFSPMSSQLMMSRTDLLKQNIVSMNVLDYASPCMGNPSVFSFDRVLYLYLFERCLRTGELSLDEGKGMLQLLEEHYSKFAGKNADVAFARKMGVPFFLLVPSGTELFMEQGAKLVFRMAIPSVVEELKSKLVLPG
ncbi:YhbD family protein [Paenibacillus sp. HB172176]|uniref:YhbD family protein n=1 Tax=Paenibacillus sp. HB172176 TaxID=2493690 RepID=UPI0014390C86|nr:YhbD family protein [Paenibacillus sp. HB172176]